MTYKQKIGTLNIQTAILYERIKVWIQRKVIWIQVNKNFIINGLSEFKIVEPRIKCRFVPITLDNCHRVKDFRENGRISKYRDKLANNEIGWFAEHNGKMIGSIWATINKTEVPRVVQSFKKAMYNEGIAHDGIVSEKFRGMQVGPFMLSNLFESLFKEYGISRIIGDCNVKNRAALRMLEQSGIRINYKILYVSLFGKPVLELVLKKYN